jgi:hypothetical protein
MTRATAPNGDEPHIRAIVFKESDFYVAQCLEYDVSAQSVTIEGLIDRLELTLEAEFEACEAAGKAPKDCIGPAQNYYHELWERRSLNVERVKVATRSPALVTLELGLAA